MERTQDPTREGRVKKSLQEIGAELHARDELARETERGASPGLRSDGDEEPEERGGIDLDAQAEPRTHGERGGQVRHRSQVEEGLQLAVSEVPAVAGEQARLEH